MNGNLSASVFLIRIKKLIELGNLKFKPRNFNKTYQFLIKEHLTVADVLNYINNLKPENYYSGPFADENGTDGNVMIFIKKYKNIKIYIKLKIWQENQKDSGLIMSFHEEGLYD